MTATTPSTAYSRDLGDELRRVREANTRYTGVRLGEILAWDQSKVSNIENGKRRASEIDLVQYLTACGQDRDVIEEFLNRYRHAFEDFIVQVPANLRTVALAESSAKTITSYDRSAIPGLLQTQDYAWALFRQGGTVSEKEFAARARFRIERQAILRRPDRPGCVFYVHEHAVRMNVGGVEVMREQYRRMLFRTHTIRIVPESAGAVGVLDANYLLWGYEKLASVAYTESVLAKLFVQDPVIVANLRTIFTRLDAVAMSEGQSRNLLTHLVGRPREELDDHGADLAEE